MRLSMLQIGLIAAGVLLVLGVLVYNALQLRRARRGVGQRMPSPAGQPAPGRDAGRVEPTLAAGAQAARSGVQVASDPEWSPPLGDVRTLPPGEVEEIEIDVPPDEGQGEPLGSSGSAGAAPRAPAEPATSAAPLPDPEIECVVTMQPAHPVSAAALAPGLHARLGKPLRWFGRREVDGTWQRLAADTRGDFAEVAAALLLADRNGAASRAQVDAFLRVIAELAPTLPAAYEAPDAETEAARAEALDRLCAELDMQIGITLQPPSGVPIPGTRLRGVAEAAGFRLAPAGRFEWVHEDNGNVLYSLQSLKGEPFSVDSLRHSSVHGVVLVLDVPRVADPPRAFDQMKLAARRMAQTLGAEMVDDNRRPLDDAALAAIRKEVQHASEQLHTVHIDPGSPRALKLFAA